MEALMADLNEMADCVIYDGPPVTGAADAQILSGATDGVLHVVEMGRARKTGLMRSADMLYHARANVIGVVLNRADGAAAYGYYTNIPRYALASQIRALPESSPAEGTPAAS
jgi:Mrp family chromosome partitioning ATPase